MNPSDLDRLGAAVAKLGEATTLRTEVGYGDFTPGFFVNHKLQGGRGEFDAGFMNFSQNVFPLGDTLSFNSEGTLYSNGEQSGDQFGLRYKNTLDIDSSSRLEYSGFAGIAASGFSSVGWRECELSQRPVRQLAFPRRGRRVVSWRARGGDAERHRCAAENLHLRNPARRALHTAGVQLKGRIRRRGCEIPRPRLRRIPDAPDQIGRHLAVPCLRAVHGLCGHRKPRRQGGHPLHPRQDERREKGFRRVLRPLRRLGFKTGAARKSTSNCARASRQPARGALKSPHEYFSHENFYRLGQHQFPALS